MITPVHYTANENLIGSEYCASTQIKQRNRFVILRSKREDNMEPYVWDAQL